MASFAQSVEIGKALLRSRKTFMLVGPPGGGKTACNDVMNNELGWHKPLVTHPAIADPVDYKGIPIIQPEGGAQFFPMGVIKEALNWDPAKGPVTLFFDDVGQAVPAVHNALMQWAHEDSRTLEGQRLPDEVRIVMASNRKEDGANVGNFSTALKGRMVIWNLLPDLESWLNWAVRAGVSPVVMAYMSMNPQHLFLPDSSTDITSQSPNPRTWKMLSDLTLIPDIPDECRKEIYEGTIGQEVAAQYLSFEAIWKDLPDLQAIMNTPMNVPVPPQTNVRFALVNALSRKTKSKRLGNIMKYIRRFPSEFIVLFTEMAIRNHEGVQEEKLFTDWCIEHQSIMT